MASLLDKLQADYGEDGPHSNRKSNGSSDVFSLANSIDTSAVLDRLGIEHDEKHATCIGCEEPGALLCENGGTRCLHNRCAHVGPKGHPGFRTNVNLVATREKTSPLAAARMLCTWFGIAYGVGKISDATETPPPEPITIPSIIEVWREEGELVRVATGIEPIDLLCRGGFLFPRRVVLAVSGQDSNRHPNGFNFARTGVPIGFLAVDEEPEDILARWAQMTGFTLDEIEKRNPPVLDAMCAKLGKSAGPTLPLRLYHREGGGRPCKICGRKTRRAVHRLLANRHIRRLENAESDRERVAGNVAAIRNVSKKHRQLIVSTSEANRRSYQSKKVAEEQNRLSTGAESRSIEFWHQVVFDLQTPKDSPDVVHVRVVKNRRHMKGEFWLKLECETQNITPCDEPRPKRSREAHPRAGQKIGQVAADAPSWPAWSRSVRG